MREKKPYQVLTFHTTDAAMEMEFRWHCRWLLPVSAGCGIAWRMEAEVYAQCSEQFRLTIFFVKSFMQVLPLFGLFVFGFTIFFIK